jgi:YggT family protein
VPFHFLAFFVELYVIILIVRALLSWIPARPGTGFEKVVRALDAITEPVLRPVRRILPPIRAGGMGIDLSILVVVIVAQVVVVPLLRA